MRRDTQTKLPRSRPWILSIPLLLTAFGCGSDAGIAPITAFECTDSLATGLLDCRGVNFSRAGRDLPDPLRLMSADFTGANFSGKDLSGLNFDGANFTAADLTDANLTGASARNADFTSADLRGAGLDRFEASLATFEGTWFDDSQAVRLFLESATGQIDRSNFSPVRASLPDSSDSAHQDQSSLITTSTVASTNSTAKISQPTSPNDFAHNFLVELAAERELLLAGNCCGWGALASYDKWWLARVEPRIRGVVEESCSNWVSLRQSRWVSSDTNIAIRTFVSDPISVRSVDDFVLEILGETLRSFTGVTFAVDGYWTAGGLGDQPATLHLNIKDTGEVFALTVPFIDEPSKWDDCRPQRD